MVQGSFSWIFYGSRSGFHDSMWILPSLMVPGRNSGLVLMVLDWVFMVPFRFYRFSVV